MELGHQLQGRRVLGHLDAADRRTGIFACPRPSVDRKRSVDQDRSPGGARVRRPVSSL